MRARTLGRWFGLTAGALGLIGWLVAFGVASEMSGLSPRTTIFFSAMLLAIGGVVLSAYKYHNVDQTGWRSLLATATGLLAVGTVLSGFTVGFLFLPAAVAALAAAVIVFLAHSLHSA